MFSQVLMHVHFLPRTDILLPLFGDYFTTYFLFGGMHVMQVGLGGVSW